MTKILLMIGQLLKAILKKSENSACHLLQEKGSTSISKLQTPSTIKNIKKENVMQRVIHKREQESEDTTLGTWYLEGKEICKTLENGWRDNQEDVSCIPAGTYICTRDRTGSFQYWKINDVPSRNNIEIHNGNINTHTLGCVIIGARWGRYKGKPAVLSSKPTLERLKKILDDKFELEIIND